jgi:hypothetical protein
LETWELSRFRAARSSILENRGKYVSLSKIAYYLIDNICVVMLSQLERRVKEKAAGCGASSELGISHLDIKIMRAGALGQPA